MIGFCAYFITIPFMTSENLLSFKKINLPEYFFILSCVFGIKWTFYLRSLLLIIKERINFTKAISTVEFTMTKHLYIKDIDLTVKME